MFAATQLYVQVLELLTTKSYLERQDFPEEEARTHSPILSSRQEQSHDRLHQQEHLKQKRTPRGHGHFTKLRFGKSSGRSFQLSVHSGLQT